MIDPLSALRGELGRVSTSDWTAGEPFVEPSYRSHGFLLEAARDSEVIEVFRGSRRMLRFDEEDELLERPYSMVELAPGEDETGPLKEPALSVLIGLAIAAAANQIVGLAARDARKRALEEIRAGRAAQQKDPERVGERPVPDEVDLGES